ncbi:MAG TPA: TetR family transcriptional regulator [Solirubrobacteraceae bacterium]|nr:TetR family transcriptional regulator [Solirubrobacteraceae bacterium]
MSASRSASPPVAATTRKGRSYELRPPRKGERVVQMQRRRLMLAIVEVAGDGGIEAATVGRVCEQAGVSRRTFYELFSDRDDCLLAAFEALLERLGNGLAEAYHRPARWIDGLRDALQLLLERLDREPLAARLCVVESLRAGPEVVERRRAAVEALVDAVDEGRAAARSGSEPLPLTAQGVVGGVLSVVHSRLLERQSSTGTDDSLLGSIGELMAMIVHPYLGVAAAREELERPLPKLARAVERSDSDPFRGLPIRFTYRTALVLATIARSPGASNRDIGRASGIADDGQVSRLLARLRDSGLIENIGGGHRHGEANSWTLSARGRVIQETIDVG